MTPLGASRRALTRLVLALIALVVALPATAAFADTVHVVQPGDTLSGIADHYGVTESDIAAHNGIENPDYIISGSRLVIPTYTEATVYGASGGGTNEYRVRLGDTLSAIAQLHGITVSGLMELNGISNPDYIVEGMLLHVPGSVAVAAATGAVTRDEVRGYLLDAAVEFGIAPDLLLALAWQESGWQHGVVSHAGAIGIMQVLPSTAAWALQDLLTGAEDWRTNPRSNVRVGAAVISRLIDQAGGDGRTGLAYYVQGWYSIAQNGWFDETEAYVTNVMALREQFR